MKDNKKENIHFIGNGFGQLNLHENTLTIVNLLLQCSAGGCDRMLQVGIGKSW